MLTVMPVCSWNALSAVSSGVSATASQFTNDTSPSPWKARIAGTGYLLLAASPTEAAMPPLTIDLRDNPLLWPVMFFLLRVERKRLTRGRQTEETRLSALLRYDGMIEIPQPGASVTETPPSFTSRAGS